MKRFFRFLFNYLQAVVRLVFSRYLWTGGLYSLALLIPDQVYSFGRRRNRDAFISLVSKFDKNIKACQIQGVWQIDCGGVKFSMKHLTNELLEIGIDFIKDCNTKLLKCLKNPDVFEGPYLTKHCTLKADDRVLDMGASLGIFSVFAALKVGPNGRILAFEPNDRAVDIMKNNLALNNINNVEIYRDVLTDSFGEIDFNVDLNGALGSSSIFEIKSDNVLHIKAKQNTLDQFVVDHCVDRVDFIKADIEGSERLMLKGAEQTIKRFKPTIAIRIYHLPDDPEVIESILKEYVPEYKIEKFGRKTLYAYLEK